MLLSYVLKVVEVLCLFFLAMLIGKLYKVFDVFPEGDAKTWVAFGVIAEVVLAVILAVNLIT